MQLFTSCDSQLLCFFHLFTFAFVCRNQRKENINVCPLPIWERQLQLSPSTDYSPTQPSTRDNRSSWTILKRDCAITKLSWVERELLVLFSRNKTCAGTYSTTSSPRSRYRFSHRAMATVSSRRRTSQQAPRSIDLNHLSVLSSIPDHITGFAIIATRRAPLGSTRRLGARRLIRIFLPRLKSVEDASWLDGVLR